MGHCRDCANQLIGSMHVPIPDEEIELRAIRAQGAGGQNVNKVSSAAHLRFDIERSSLPAELKERLRALPDQRITAEGVIVIKAQEYRTQEQNRADAFQRLDELLRQAAFTPRTRKATKPTYGSQKRRLEGKSKKSEVKKMRGKVDS